MWQLTASCRWSRIYPPSTQPKRNPVLWVLVTILLLIMVWVGLRLSTHAMGPTLGASTLTPQARVYSQSFNRAFIIRAIGFEYVPFTVPAGSSNVKLQGHFSARGAGNDVEVFLLSEDSFANWKNGHQVNAVYSSGKVTHGKPAHSC